ncbi:hypothetical protein VTO42DRAFT_8551 [Malbranchea cinnamomea]
MPGKRKVQRLPTLQEQREEERTPGRDESAESSYAPSKPALPQRFAYHRRRSPPPLTPRPLQFRHDRVGLNLPVDPNPRVGSMHNIGPRMYGPPHPIRRGTIYFPSAFVSKKWRSQITTPSDTSDPPPGSKYLQKSSPQREWRELLAKRESLNKDGPASARSPHAINSGGVCTGQKLERAARFDSLRQNIVPKPNPRTFRAQKRTSAFLPTVAEESPRLGASNSFLRQSRFRSYNPNFNLETLRRSNDYNPEHLRRYLPRTQTPRPEPQRPVYYATLDDPHPWGVLLDFPTSVTIDPNLYDPLPSERQRMAALANSTTQEDSDVRLRDADGDIFMQDPNTRNPPISMAGMHILNTESSPIPLQSPDMPTSNGETPRPSRKRRIEEVEEPNNPSLTPNRMPMHDVVEENEAFGMGIPTVQGTPIRGDFLLPSRAHAPESSREYLPFNAPGLIPNMPVEHVQPSVADMPSVVERAAQAEPEPAENAQSIPPPVQPRVAQPHDVQPQNEQLQNDPTQNDQLQNLQPQGVQPPELPNIQDLLPQLDIPQWQIDAARLAWTCVLKPTAKGVFWLVDRTGRFVIRQTCKVARSTKRRLVELYQVYQSERAARREQRRRRASPQGSRVNQRGSNYEQWLQRTSAEHRRRAVVAARRNAEELRQEVMREAEERRLAQEASGDGHGENVIEPTPKKEKTPKRPKSQKPTPKKDGHKTADNSTSRSKLPSPPERVRNQASKSGKRAELRILNRIPRISEEQRRINEEILAQWAMSPEEFFRQEAIRRGVPFDPEDARIRRSPTPVRTPSDVRAPSPAPFGISSQDDLYFGFSESLEQAHLPPQTADWLVAEDATQVTDVPAASTEMSDEEAKEISEAKEESEEEIINEVQDHHPNLHIPAGAVIVPLSAEWESRVHTAMSSPENRQLATTLRGDPLTRRDLATCYTPMAWLNDEVINAYLDLIVDYARRVAGNSGRHAQPKYHAFNSFFYSNLRDKGYDSVRRWASRAKIGGSSLLNVDTVFVPVHDHMHWTLVVVKPVARTIEHFDSLGGPSRAHISRIKTWLRGELGSLYREDEWRVLPSSSPQQNNGSDCGVFLLTTAKLVALGLPLRYGANDIPEVRKRIVAELLNGGFEGDFDPRVEISSRSRL